MSCNVSLGKSLIKSYSRVSIVSVCFSVQSLMVAKAKEMLEQEVIDKEEEKERYLEEKAPPVQTGRMSFAELQVCTHSHSHKINY